MEPVPSDAQTLSHTGQRIQAYLTARNDWRTASPFLRGTAFAGVA